MSESLQKTLYVKLQELIGLQSEGEWDDAMVASDARKFTAALVPMFAALEAERDTYKKALESIALIENQLVGFDWEEIDAARELANAALAAGMGK